LQFSDSKIKLKKEEKNELKFIVEYRGVSTGKLLHTLFPSLSLSVRPATAAKEVKKRKHQKGTYFLLPRLWFLLLP
jgi:hypothetical protein